MTNPQLRTKTIRIARRLEAQRYASRSSDYAGSRDYDKAAARNVHVSDLLDGNRRINPVKILGPLIVQGSAVPGPKTPPARWIELDSSQELDRIIRERVQRSAANVLSRP
jgi:hypothetical protein